MKGKGAAAPDRAGKQPMVRRAPHQGALVERKMTEYCFVHYE
jgi:hypothetical protein